MQGDPLVSIRCLVYNHEPFLRQCLDGFVMQKTTFPFEAIVHDDASTDGSAAIIREYAEKYPDIIKPIFETENLYSKHDASLRKVVLEAIHPSAKYIAVCEGDDYWTDPNKLQIQIDFLESHPDYVMSSHDFADYKEDTKELEFGQSEFSGFQYNNAFNGYDYCTFTIDDYYYGKIWFMQTLTIVYRKQEYVSIDKIKLYPKYYDYINCYYIIKRGKCVFFKKNMAVYRIQKNGAFSGRDIEAWSDSCLSNYYLLFELENDKKIFTKINKHFTILMLYYFKHFSLIKAYNLFRRHLRRTSVSNAIFSVIAVLKGIVVLSFIKLRSFFHRTFDK